MLLFRYRKRPNSMVRTVGTTREEQILASFADRHADYLRANADWLFRASLRRIKELERVVALLRKHSLLFRLGKIVLRRYHAIQSRPNSASYRLLRQLRRRSRRIRNLCVRLDTMIP